MDKKGCLFDVFYTCEDLDEIRNGVVVGNARFDAGRKLSRIYSIDGDSVIGVPNSAIRIGEGYAFESGIKLATAVTRNPLFGRSFLQPDKQSQVNTAQNKFIYDQEQIEGQRLVVIDDSIVRGNVSKIIAENLRKRGAKEIHFLTASPLIINQCVQGKRDFHDLINNRVSNLKGFLKVDSLHFMPPKDALETYCAEGKGCGKCMGDFEL